MRSLGALICGIAAAVGFLVAVPAWWTATHITSTEGFVDIMAPVSVDDEMHEALAEEIARVLLEDRDVAESVAASVESAVARVTRSLASTETFSTMWDRTVADSRAATLEAQDDRLYADLTFVTSTVTEKTDAIPGVTLQSPKRVRIAMSRESHPAALFLARYANAIAWAATAATILLAGAAVWLARSRPGAMLILALSAFSSVALLRLLWDVWVPATLSNGSTDSVLAHNLLNAVGEYATSSSHRTLTYLAIGAVIAVVVTGLWRLARPPREARLPAGASNDPAGASNDPAG